MSRLVNCNDRFVDLMDRFVFEIEKIVARKQ